MWPDYVSRRSGCSKNSEDRYINGWRLNVHWGWDPFGKGCWVTEDNLQTGEKESTVNLLLTFKLQQEVKG